LEQSKAAPAEQTKAFLNQLAAGLAADPNPAVQVWLHDALHTGLSPVDREVLRARTGHAARAAGLTLPGNYSLEVGLVAARAAARYLETSAATEATPQVPVGPAVGEEPTPNTPTQVHTYTPTHVHPDGPDSPPSLDAAGSEQPATSPNPPTQVHTYTPTHVDSVPGGAASIEPGRGGPVSRFDPGLEILVPSTPQARAEANLAAIELLRQLDAEGRPATPAEQQVLARWSSWGAVPQAFEAGRPEWDDFQRRLADTLDDTEMAAASATTLNAHYTDPRIVAAMWDAAQQAGLTRGLVLEPGCGAGVFINQAPAGIDMVGVELDPITAQIAAHLNPDAAIRAEGFERTVFPDETPFQGAIGNVPFGHFAPVDPLYNPARLSIHNYFIVKAMQQVQVGGLGLFITSSYTMDAQTSTARAQILRHAHLLGAVRLPTGTFRRVAGTEVVTDVLVLRRRQPGKPVSEEETAWLHTDRLVIDEQATSVHVNRYWATHPDHVLGQVQVGSGMYGQDTLQVRATPGADLAEMLADRLHGILDAAGLAGLAYQPDPGPAARRPEWAAPGLTTPTRVGEGIKDGHIRTTPDDGFERYVAARDRFDPVRVPARQAGETRALLALRDATTALVATQTTGAPPAARDQARADLAGIYDRYVATYGPINRYTLTEPRQPSTKQVAARLTELEQAWRDNLPGDLTGKERAAEPVPDETLAEWDEIAHEPFPPVKRQPHLALLRTDPDFAAVIALELFDEDTQTATKAPIFSRDIVTRQARPDHADSPADAVAIVMAETGSTVDLGRAADLLGVDLHEARELLTGLVYDDPATGQLIPAALYLSGNVRTKLAAARRMVAGDPEAGISPDLAYQANVEALEAVLPADIALEDIATKPGVRFVSPAMYEQFIRETLSGPGRHIEATVTISPVNDTWEIEGPPSSKFADSVMVTYGSPGHASPLDLLERVMNNRAITIYDYDSATRTRSVNPVATAQARANAAALTARFTTWLGEDPDRAAQTAAAYNAAYNSYVAPDYTQLGAGLVFDGLADSIEPRPWQREAVAQILYSPSALLDHVVGAGKTGTIILAAHELRRTGLATKPWVVVPNHLVEQWTREWRQWIPDATLLAIPTGLNPAGRREYAARAAAGDWDAVICPQSVFKTIQIDPIRAGGWLQTEIGQLKAAAAQALAESGGKKNKAARVKRIEAAIKRLEGDYAIAMSGKDPGVTFEQTGADYLFIDEAHHYKNLARTSDHADLSHAGSQQARDLDFKLRALREAKSDDTSQVGMSGAPTVTFATGTPMANQIGERWVMAHFLRPDLLGRLGLTKVDAWATQFTKQVTRMELGPDGTTWRMQTRVGAFMNVPELRALERQFTSTVTTDQVATKAPIPALAGGARQIMSREPSEQVAAYVADLARRAANLPADPSEDNLLVITSDGANAALDPRLVGLPADPESRITQAADTIIDVWREHADQVYLDETGQPSPITGGLQLVFLDRSTPKPGHWSLYEELRSELARRGMDPTLVRFIHEARNDVERADLFKACREGRVAVLVGSTQKMGTGMNVQTRAVALHHLDCPWRPADLEQREGRILRQGNQNPEVRIFNYVTERTYDAVIWQHVVRKALNNEQMRRGNLDAREQGVDTGGFVVSAALAQAVATGDEKVMRRAELLEQITQLETLEVSHQATRTRLRSQAGRYQAQSQELAGLVSQLEPLVTQITSTRGDQFGLRTPEGAWWASRKQAGTYLAGLCRNLTTDPDAHLTVVGVIGGVELAAIPAKTLSGAAAVRVFPKQAAAVGVTWPAHSWDDGKEPSDAQLAGLAQRAENLVASLPGELDQTREALTAAEAAHADVNRQLDQMGPFNRTAELDQLRAELAEIDEALQASGSDPASEETTGPALVDSAVAHGAYPTDDVDWDQLRAGDMVRRTGYGASKTAALLEARGGVDGQIELVDTATGEPFNRAGYAKFTIVTRLAAVLTPFEHHVIQPGWARYTRTYGEPETGARVAVQTDPTDPASGVVEGVLREIVKEPADPDRTYYQPKPVAAMIRLDDGTLHRHPVPDDYPRYKSIAVYSPPTQTRANAAGMIPATKMRDLKGFIVAASADPEKLPAGVVPNGWDSFRTIDGTEIKIRADQVEVTPVAYPALTEAEFAAAGATGPGEATIKDLKTGDLVPACQIDPQMESSTRSARIIYAHAQQRLTTLEYVFDDDPTFEVHSAKRGNHLPATIQERTWACLNAGQLELLANPGATMIGLAGPAGERIDAADLVDRWFTARWYDSHRDRFDVSGKITAATYCGPDSSGVEHLAVTHYDTLSGQSRDRYMPVRGVEFMLCDPDATGVVRASGRQFTPDDVPAFQTAVRQLIGADTATAAVDPSPQAGHDPAVGPVQEDTAGPGGAGGRDAGDSEAAGRHVVRARLTPTRHGIETETLDDEPGRPDWPAMDQAGPLPGPATASYRAGPDSLGL
jgi:N12 class adenine-specific DNA methylase